MDFVGAISREIFDISWYWWIVLAVIMIGMMIWRKNIFESLIVGYVFLILVITLLDRGNVVESNYGTAQLIPFWSYGEPGLKSEIILNYLLFIPLGILLAWKKKMKLSRVWLTGACFSLVIEICQFVFSCGLFEFDDVIGNSVGGLIGALVVGALKRIRQTGGRK